MPRLVDGVAQETWPDVVGSMRRLERVPLRRMARSLLAGPTGTKRAEDDPLRMWLRLGQAISQGQVTPLDELLHERSDGPATCRQPGTRPALGWDERAARVVDDLLARCHTSHPRSSAAVVLGFCYLECVVFWEYTTDVSPLEAVLRVVAARATELAQEGGPGAAEPVPGGDVALLCGLAAACDALRGQFGVEDAWLSGSPEAVIARAGTAVGELEDARELLHAGAPDAGGGRAPLSSTAAAASVTHAAVLESVEDAVAYFTLLSVCVGPAAAAFARNLAERTDDAAVAAMIEAARSAVDAAVSGPGAIKGVFRTEARAQGRTLEAMLAIVGDAGRNGEPTLVVDGGEIHYLYPFGMSLSRAGGGDVVGAALRRHFEGDMRPQLRSRPLIAGRQVSVEDTLQTEVFAQAARVIDPSGGSRMGARLVFEDSQLVLDSQDGRRYCGLDVEVLLGPLGNHLVRIGVSTATSLEQCSAGARHGDAGCTGTFDRVPGSWSPHHLDVWLHRGGLEVGEERLYFAPVDGPAAHEPPPKSWPSLTELAAAIVNDLARSVASLPADPSQGRVGTARGPAAGSEVALGSPPTDDLREPAEGVPGPEVPEEPQDGVVVPKVSANELRRQAHVLVVLNEAASVVGGRRTPLRTSAELAACRGSVRLLSSQPPAYRALQEWTCAPPAGARAPTSSVVGSMDSHIMCNGDVTLVFAPASPNWQLLEDRELIMFALSLGSTYAMVRERLTSATDAVAEVSREEDRIEHDRAGLAALATKVHQCEQDLAHWVAFADSLIDHARGATVIRPRRDRSLLDHVTESSGVQDLQDAMSATRQVASDRLGDLRELSGKLIESERRLGQQSVERFLMVVAVLAFVDLFWFFFDVEEEVLGWSWGWYFLVVTGIIGAAALVVWRVVFSRRRTAVSHAE